MHPTSPAAAADSAARFSRVARRAVIYMDIPGMTREMIKLSRQNVVTIVKGTRPVDHTEHEVATAVTRQERKTGDFTMTFRIPEEYNRRWDKATVEDGVLEIRYLKDTDEEDQ